MLHHYTTVNTLALILKNKTLRFARLDQFDDVTEGRSLGVYPFGSRMFASCWSAADTESIPQWAMYGDAMRGIRISLRQDPFIWNVIDIDWHENFLFKKMEAPFSLEAMLGENITLIPINHMKQVFGQIVRYVSDVPAEIEKFVTHEESGKIILHGYGNEIAFFKPDLWAFQEEFRYVLNASIGPPTPYRGDKNAYIEARGLWHKTGVNLLTDIPNRLHVDLELDPDALSSAEILVGPLAPAGTMEIVEALVANFAEGATVKPSSLSGTIRPK